MADEQKVIKQKTVEEEPMDVGEIMQNLASLISEWKAVCVVKQDKEANITELRKVLDTVHGISITFSDFDGVQNTAKSSPIYPPLTDGIPSVMNADIENIEDPDAFNEDIQIRYKKVLEAAGIKGLDAMLPAPLMGDTLPPGIGVTVETTSSQQAI